MACYVPEIHKPNPFYDDTANELMIEWQALAHRKTDEADEEECMSDQKEDEENCSVASFSQSHNEVSKGSMFLPELSPLPTLSSSSCSSDTTETPSPTKKTQRRTLPPSPNMIECISIDDDSEQEDVSVGSIKAGPDIAQKAAAAMTRLVTRHFLEVNSYPPSTVQCILDFIGKSNIESKVESLTKV